MATISQARARFAGLENSARFDAVSEPVNYWDSIEAHSRVEEIWGSHPLVRARINRRISGDPHTWTTSWLAKRLEGMPRLREAVSIGCGMGHFERDLVRLDLVDRITGIEISPVCVAEARGGGGSGRHAGAHRLPLRRRLGGARAAPRPRRDLLSRLAAPLRPPRGDGRPPAARAEARRAALSRRIRRTFARRMDARRPVALELALLPPAERASGEWAASGRRSTSRTRPRPSPPPTSCRRSPASSISSSSATTAATSCR